VILAKVVRIPFRFLYFMACRIVIAAGNVVPGTVLRFDYGVTDCWRVADGRAGDHKCNGNEHAGGNPDDCDFHCEASEALMVSRRQGAARRPPPDIMRST
jgi:hypothetical protein